MAEEKIYHVPVLLHESVDGLNICKNGIYVDVTFGGGGHSREILGKLSGDAHLFSFDQDFDAFVNVDKVFADNDHFTFVRGNFRYLKNFLRYYGYTQVDGILADLGVSSHHFDDSERGFSFRFQGKLDMRMNQRADFTAADVLNTYSEDKLADMFYMYGELKQSRKLALAIVKRRQQHAIETVEDFINLVQPLLSGRRTSTDLDKKDMAKVFQALRIEVNQEMDALRAMLTQAAEVLKPGGRLSVITYHSLEDRMVKNLMKTGNVEGRMEQDFFGRTTCLFRLINNKVIVPSAEEQANNPRSRSAKLRIAEKK